jgi:two-component system OmpR family sensor kinase
MSSSPPSEVSFRDDAGDEPTPEDLPDGAGDPPSGVATGPDEPRPSLRQQLARARDDVPPWSAWTLRAKLVASMLVLFTVISIATGAFTVFALQRQLTGQVDEQLQTSIIRLVSDRRLDLGVQEGDPDRPRGPGDEGLVAFLPATTTSAFPSAEGKVMAGSRGASALTTVQFDQLSAAGLGPEPRTVELTGLGSYRLKAFPTAVDRSVDGVPVRTPGALVVGLSMGPSESTVRQMLFIGVITVGAGLVLVAVLGTLIVRRNLEPLRRVAATATRVSKMPLESGQVALAVRVDPADTDTRTEVGQVGAAFNDMLAHVDEALNARHQSEQRVRQFVADASHELRTPLASIKGYAELSRREPTEVPAPVTHAMGRIESEASRMSSLVEDLLLLARLDAGRPLEESRVDMSMLVINAVSDAHAAAPGHAWDLDLPPEPIEVRGDPARLHQIVANLLANARTHTPEGTRVTTSVRTEGDWVRVAVHDNGPGVPVPLQANVFERFARGDDARVRANGSTGLGLSIVAAVTKAHGGRVELDSRPGDTTFSLVLPAV